jgi:hypothetical protein
LQRTAGPYMRVIRDRCSRSCLPVHVCFRPRKRPTSGGGNEIDAKGPKSDICIAEEQRAARALLPTYPASGSTLCTAAARLERPLRLHLVSSAFVFNRFDDPERSALRYSTEMTVASAPRVCLAGRPEKREYSHHIGSRLGNPGENRKLHGRLIRVQIRGKCEYGYWSAELQC